MKCSRKIWIITIGISTCVAVLFYRSMYGFLLTPVIYSLVKKQVIEKETEKEKQKLLEQFLHGIHVLDTSLQAGLSMENAWIEVQKEIGLLYGKAESFYKYVKEINHLVSLNKPVEQCVLAFAEKSEIEDIVHFANVFAYGKRSGGNWKQIIGNVVQKLSEKEDAKQQIMLMVAEKKLEQQVMSVIPLGILAFLQISSWDYLSVMYHNPVGIFCMTVILAAYGFSMFLAERIIQIKV